MPRDGSGGYDRVSGTPYVANTTIDEVVVNSEMDDLGNELANSLSKDGQTVPTANLPMGGYKHTGVGNATARDSYAALGQVQDGTPVYASAGGTADALTLTLSPAPAAYAAGQEFRFLATATNTGAATLNVNSLGIKDIKRDGSSALAAGDITTGQMYSVRYDGTNFQLLNASTFVTQSASNSTTLPATTAMVQAAITARTASDTQAGIAELATSTEYATGTDTARILTVAVARGGNVVRLSSNATTSGTGITVTAIPSWVKHLMISLNDVSMDGTDTLSLQLGDSGGVETTGYVSTISAGTSAVDSTSGFLVVTNSAGAASTFTGVIHLFNATGNTWICSGVSGCNGNRLQGIFNGSKTLSGTFDRFSLITTGGAVNLDGGSITVFYE